jgi:hypothetical protein
MVPAGSKTVEGADRETAGNVWKYATLDTRRRATQLSRMARAPRKQPRRWSQRVTRTSDALDLESGVFRMRSPRAIARSLARSAEASKRRKSEPFRSAMSMLTFYVNRAGKKLPARDRTTLMRAKQELRKLYGRA